MDQDANINQDEDAVKQDKSANNMSIQYVYSENAGKENKPVKNTPIKHSYSFDIADQDANTNQNIVGDVNRQSNKKEPATHSVDNVFHFLEVYEKLCAYLSMHGNSAVQQDIPEYHLHTTASGVVNFSKEFSKELGIKKEDVKTLERSADKLEKDAIEASMQKYQSSTNKLWNDVYAAIESLAKESPDFEKDIHFILGLNGLPFHLRLPELITEARKTAAQQKQQRIAGERKESHAFRHGLDNRHKFAKFSQSKVQQQHNTRKHYKNPPNYDRGR